MLTAKDAAGATSQKQERRSGVLQEEGRMPEHDKEAIDMQTKCARAAVAKHTRVCQGLNDPQLCRPQQKQVSILDDLVEEEASMIVTRRRRKQHETKPGPAQTSASPQSRLNFSVKLFFT